MTVFVHIEKLFRSSNSVSACLSNVGAVVWNVTYVRMSVDAVRTCLGGLADELGVDMALIMESEKKMMTFATEKSWALIQAQHPPLAKFAFKTLPQKFANRLVIQVATPSKKKVRLAFQYLESLMASTAKSLLVNMNLRNGVQIIEHGVEMTQRQQGRLLGPGAHWACSQRSAMQAIRFDTESEPNYISVGIDPPANDITELGAKIIHSSRIVSLHTPIVSN